jgi:hypothetical protein
MKRFRVTKLKLSASAAYDLSRQRLTTGDLDIILALGQRLDCTNLVLQIFDASLLPAKKRLRRLDGFILVIRDSEIAAVCKNLTDVIEWRKQQ